jgi:8-oxo-dGTP diphosphatase
MNATPTRKQVSAGGVVFRKWNGTIEAALILVGEEGRWQLPKGIVDPGEATETTALREVQEETGLQAELVELIDVIEYWYYSGAGGKRVRFHKYVHFYLLKYLAGDVADHDHEVSQAGWFEIREAIEQLAFKTEKEVVEKALVRIEALGLD